MWRLQIGLVAVAVAVTLGVSARPAVAACGSWQVVAGAQTAGAGELFDVSATSARDAWAVGFNNAKPLAELLGRDGVVAGSRGGSRPRVQPAQ
jgi:hypothetical protein